MNNTEISCTICGCPASCIGMIPDECFVGGVLLEEPIKGGELWECIQCKWGFRVSNGKMKEPDPSLYLDMDINYWSVDEELRNDWKMIRLLIKDIEFKSILDLGCWKGDFLASLPNDYDKFGVELNCKACEVAESRGIEIIAQNLDEIRESDKKFDLITAIDLIEHLKNPFQLLKDATEMLNDGGHIMISTGNFYAITRHFCGAEYWYCVDTEHISFLSEEWFKKVSLSLGLSVLSVKRFSHFESGYLKKIKEAFANIIYKLFPFPLVGYRYMKTNKKGKSVSLKNAFLRYPPMWTTARDHLAIILKKDKGQFRSL